MPKKTRLKHATRLISQRANAQTRNNRQNKSIKQDKIKITGARVNNLKNINIAIPRNCLVVVTGLSGSGKSSLAFDVVYAEGSRRYLESLSSYVRQFLEISGKPDVDKIENLSPAISIDQKSISRSSRSTVGTLTEIYDYLRVLYAKIGVPYCPNCLLPMKRKSHQEILKDILNLPDNTQLAILALIKREKEKNVRNILKSISQLGYARARVGGKIMPITDTFLIPKKDLKGDIEIVIDRIILKKNNLDKERILDSIETAFKVGKGSMAVCVNNTNSRIYNHDFVCSHCHFKIPQITPKHFSFNNPEGACPHCSGLGIVQELDENLIIPNKNLSLAEGAVLPLVKFGGHLNGQEDYLGILEKIGERKGFSINEPIKNIAKNNLDIILHGFGEKQDKLFFTGIISLIKKKYKGITPFSSHSEIEKYMLEKTCPVCLGKRIKREYLSVLISGKSIDDLVRMNIDRSWLLWKHYGKNH